MKETTYKEGLLFRLFGDISQNRLRQNIPYFIMMLPNIIFTVLFSYLPIFGIIIAFKKFNPRLGIFSSPWCGFDNFKFLLSSSDTPIILRNTIGYNLVFIFLGMVLNVCVALLLSSILSKLATKVYQTVIIMPHFLSMVIIAYIVYAFLSTRAGYMNRAILPMFGIEETVSWYTTVKAWPWILILVHFWKDCGYGSIIYLAAIAGVDQELYEAAEIDGANRWKQIFHVTLPSIKPIIVIQLILNVGKIFNADFGLFYQVPMNSGPLYPATNVLSVFVYNSLGQGGITGVGMSAAASFFQSVVGFILVVTANQITRIVDEENSMF